MRGYVLEFSVQNSSGLIAGDDGNRYDFVGSEWNDPNPPARDMRVDFQTEQGRFAAYDIRVINQTRREPSPRNDDRDHLNSQPRPLPDNYLVWSIAVTLLCCLPTGIVAIVYSSKVNSLHRNGQYQEAKDAANSAKSWIWGSVALGIAIGVIAFIGAMSEGY